MKWQPMDTAPKDGSWILLAFSPVARFDFEQENRNDPPVVAQARWVDWWQVLDLNSHGCGCCSYNNPEPIGWTDIPVFDLREWPPREWQNAAEARL